MIDHSLTVYGQGSQKRGFLTLKDSMQCLTLALENPPAVGEYRVFNQFADVYNITELALMVQKVAKRLGLKVEVRCLENPRHELSEHHYNPAHQHLFDLGYCPSHDVEAEIGIMLQDLWQYRDRIQAKKDILIPEFHWDGRREKVKFFTL